MIRQLSMNGLKFHTPRYTDSVEAYSKISHKSHRVDFVITEESLIVLNNPQIGAIFSEATVDVLGYVNEIPFVIYVIYKDRFVPKEINPPNVELCGVVAIDINNLQKSFSQEREGRYIEVLKDFIEQKTDGKSWIYHPRAVKARKLAETEMKEWLSSQKPPLYYQTTHSIMMTRSRRDSIPLKVAPHIPTKPIAQKVENYECIMCGANWTSISSQCKTCGTHLYTKKKVIKDDS